MSRWSVNPLRTTQWISHTPSEPSIRNDYDDDDDDDDDEHVAASCGVTQLSLTHSDHDCATPSASPCSSPALPSSSSLSSSSSWSFVIIIVVLSSANASDYQGCQFSCNLLHDVNIMSAGYNGNGRLRLAMPSATGYVVCDRLLTSATELLQKENEQYPPHCTFHRFISANDKRH